MEPLALAGYKAAAVDGPCGDADHPVDLDILFKKYVQDSGGIDAPHAAALQDQSGFFRIHMITPRLKYL